MPGKVRILSAVALATPDSSLTYIQSRQLDANGTVLAVCHELGSAHRGFDLGRLTGLGGHTWAAGASAATVPVYPAQSAMGVGSGVAIADTSSKPSDVLHTYCRVARVTSRADNHCLDQHGFSGHGVLT